MEISETYTYYLKSRVLHIFGTFSCPYVPFLIKGEFNYEGI